MLPIFAGSKHTFPTHSRVRLGRYASVAALLLCCSLTLAQKNDGRPSPTPTPTPAPRPTPTPTTQTSEQPSRSSYKPNNDIELEQPRRTGSGSFGINIDIGSVINLLREVTKKDLKCEPEVEQRARSQYSQSPMQDKTIEKYVADICQEHKAEKHPPKPITSALSTNRQGAKITRQEPTCKVNGNFETNSLTSWTGADNGPKPRTPASLSSITNIGINQGTITLDSTHQTIVAPGSDPNVGAALQMVRPSGGGSAVRIGNTSVLNGAELLSKSFTVTPADSVVGFSYAVVLNDGGHSSDNPKFIVRVLDGTGVDITNNITGGRVHLSAVSGLPTNELIYDKNNPNPFLQKYAYGYWKDWSCAEIDLSDMVGKDVTIEFITQDCAVNSSAHYAYAYIDDFCTTCGPGPEGSIKLAESDKCGAGKVCVDVTIPKTGTTTGQATASLDIWQNGIKLTTYSSPPISADGKVCFPINPSSIPGLDMSKGFDYSAQASMTIQGASGPYSLPTKLLGAGPDGLQPGSNNDYTPTCGNVTNTPLCITCLCGHPGQPVCPACGQAGQPLCAESCLAADYTNPIIPIKPRNAVGNASTKVKK